MKTIHVIAAEYDLDWLSQACKEIYEFNLNGLWPKYCPCMNDLKSKLALEGYPSSQIQNIAIDFVTMWAIGVLPMVYSRFKELL